MIHNADKNVRDAFIQHEQAWGYGFAQIPVHAPNMRDSIPQPSTPEEMYDETLYDAQGVFTCIANHSGWSEHLAKLDPFEMRVDEP